MNKPKLNPNYPTIPILICTVITGLFVLAVGISGIVITYEALATGRIYTLGIIFDGKTMIFRSSSPAEYWAMIVLYIIGGVGGGGLGIFTPISVIIDYIKKLSPQKGQR